MFNETIYSSVFCNVGSGQARSFLRPQELHVPGHHRLKDIVAFGRAYHRVLDNLNTAPSLDVVAAGAEPGGPREVFQFSVMLLRLFGPLHQRDHGWRSVGRHRGPPIASAVTARRANVVFRRLGG